MAYFLTMLSIDAQKVLFIRSQTAADLLSILSCGKSKFRHFLCCVTVEYDILP